MEKGVPKKSSIQLFYLQKESKYIKRPIIYSLILFIAFSEFMYSTSKSEKAMHPTPVLLPGESHGQRSLVGCSPWGHSESHTTERLHFHFSLSCIGEGNGNPLQCSCLENPRDGRAWWAAVYGVAQGRTRLKRLSSSSSSYLRIQEVQYVMKFIMKQLIAKKWIDKNRVHQPDIFYSNAKL